MKYEVYILLEIDPEASFLGADTNHLEDDLTDKLRSLLYDLDDVDVLSIYLKGHNDDYG